MAIKAQWTPQPSPPTCCTPATAASRLPTGKLAVMLDEICALCILWHHGNEDKHLPGISPP